MMTLARSVAAAMVATAFAWTATTAAADQWNDKTTITFSAPVMVPGMTLPAGTYVFELMDSQTNRHLVRIRRESDGKVLTTTHAVPTKRLEPRGDVVVKFDPTESGAAPALKAWFYPGTVYGHQFVYSDEQAKAIAQRTKTLVLSIDQSGTDGEKGALHTYDATGVRSAWRGDDATMKEWDQWRKNRTASLAGDTDAEERRQATAPMIQDDFTGQRIKLDEIEDNPKRYLGKTVSIDAEVEDVYGPRLFTIDEPNWADLQGEILVMLPSPLAALVSENDRVTITGTLKPFVRAEVERSWGWLGLDTDTEVEFSRKPVLVASRIVGGDNNRAMVITVDKAAGQTAGKTDTSNTPAQTSAQSQQSTASTRQSASSAPQSTSHRQSAHDMTAVSDPQVVARADVDFVGHEVNLTVPVHAKAKDRGFFVKAGDRQVYVLPAFDQVDIARSGEKVTLEGVVLQMPRQMRDRIEAPQSANDDIYIYATDVSRQTS
jgi:hypothetical protein